MNDYFCEIRTPYFIFIDIPYVCPVFTTIVPSKAETLIFYFFVILSKALGECLLNIGLSISSEDRLKTSERRGREKSLSLQYLISSYLPNRLASFQDIICWN